MVPQHPHFYSVKIALEAITDLLFRPNLYVSILTILLNLNLNFSLFISQSGKQRTERSRSRSGSGTTTPTNPTIPSSAILPSPAALLSALSQPTRSIRGKAGVSMSSPARLLSTDARSGGSSSRGGASGRLIQL